MKLDLYNVCTENVMKFRKMLKKSYKSHEIWLCIVIVFKKSFFNFLISSGLSVTSLKPFQRVIRSLKIGKRSLKVRKKVMTFWCTGSVWTLLYICEVGWGLPNLRLIWNALSCFGPCDIFTLFINNSWKSTLSRYIINSLCSLKNKLQLKDRSCFNVIRGIARYQHLY